MKKLKEIDRLHYLINSILRKYFNEAEEHNIFRAKDDIIKLIYTEQKASVREYVKILMTRITKYKDEERDSI